MGADDRNPADTLAELRARVNRLEAELAEAHADLEALSYSVSHDLRAPLRAIQGFSQLVIEDCRDVLPETGREHLTRVSASARRMSLLIDDLVELSRVGRVAMTLAPVDLSTLVLTVWRRLAYADPSREISLTVADGLRVDADPRLLDQAFEHLLDNALKFTSRTPSPAIEVGIREVEGETALFVRDNGAGFDQTYAGRLFAPFQRLHDAGDFPGHGIGLAIVRRIVRRHGGRVWAEGAIGAGATISFTIPQGPGVF